MRGAGPCAARWLGRSRVPTVYIAVMTGSAAALSNRLPRVAVVSAIGVLLWYLALLGCSEPSRTMRVGSGNWWRGGTPDELPQMENSELPFRYPVDLYRRHTQGNVMLRLYVDATGTVVPDSTRVAQPSGEPLLDSAAIADATRLRFRPARRRGVPIAVVMLFPVHFRHPDEPRLPGDSL